MKEQDNKDQKKHKNIFLKILEGIPGVILTIVCLIVITVYFFLDPIVKYRIIKEVNRSSDGLYVLQIEDLDAKFWSGAITMREVWLRPDGRVLQQMREKNPSVYVSNVNMRLDSVKISSINWFSYLLNRKKLEIGRVLISKPDFIFQSHSTETSNIQQSNKTFIDYLPGIIAAFTGSLRIEAIQIVEGNMHVDIHSKAGILHQVADSIQIDLTKILIDTVASKNALYSKTAYLDIRNYNLSTPNGQHSLSIKRLHGVVEDSLLVLDKVKYKRNDTVESKYPNTIKVDINKVESKGLNFRNLLQEKKIALRTLRFKKPQVALRAYEMPYEKIADHSQDEDSASILDQIAPYIYGTFTMDTFAVENGSINYAIRNANREILQSANNIYLDFSRIKLDTSKKKDSRIYVEDVNLKLNNYDFLKDKKLHVRIEALRASVKDSLLHLKNFAFRSIGKDSFDMKTLALIGTGIDYLKVLQSKQLHLNTLKIQKPEILITNFKKQEDSLNQKQTVPTENLLKENLGPLAGAGLKANLIQITDGELKHVFRSKTSYIEQFASKVNASLYNISFDSSTSAKNDLYDRFICALKNYQVYIHDENFKISVKDITADSEKRNFDLKDIEIAQIRTSGPDQRYYFKANIKQTLATNFDFDRFINSRQVHIHDLDVNDFNLYIYLNEGKAVRPEYAHNMPMELMRKIPFYLRVDTVRLNHSNISYLDLDPHLKDPGRLTFDRLNLLAYNFTNDSLLMTDATPAVMRGSAYLMGEGLLKFNIIIPLLSKDFDAFYTGTIDTMSGTAFNSLLAFADVKVETGRILPGEFMVEVIQGSAVGRLRFEYDDLHIKVLDPKTRKTKKFKSIVGNFVVKNGNPKHKKDDPEVVSLCGKRTEDDSFFYFVWRVLKDGIVTTVTKDSIYKRLAKLSD